MTNRVLSHGVARGGERPTGGDGVRSHCHVFANDGVLTHGVKGGSCRHGTIFSKTGTMLVPQASAGDPAMVASPMPAGARSSPGSTRRRSLEGHGGRSGPGSGTGPPQ